MGDYIVIYDPAKEIAAVVDAENRIGFGPAMIGPDAERALTEFLEGIEYDVTGVDSAVLRSWFEGWAGEHFQPTATPAANPAGSALEPVPGNGMDAAGALAEHEAANTTGVPGAQPADPDMEADEGSAGEVADPTSAGPTATDANGAEPPPYAGPCFACNGEGVIRLVPDDPPVTCSACRGTGKLPAPVA